MHGPPVLSILGAVLVAVVRAVLFFAVSIRAASQLHDNMLKAVLAAPMSYFSAHPLGRMLNRFSSDQGQLDETLPPIFFDAIQCASMVLGTVVMVCVAIPWICIAMLPLT